MRVLIALALAFSACDAKRVERQVAADSVAEYDLARKGGDAVEICVHAGLVAAAFLQAHDEANYLKWKETERADCGTAPAPAARPSGPARLVDKICACQNTACVERTLRAARPAPKDARQPTAEELDQAMRDGQRMGDCQKRIAAQRR